MEHTRPLTSPACWEEFPATVIDVDSLLPDLEVPLRRWEVILTVPREDDGEPLVPFALPGAVLGCWSATEVTASALVDAEKASEAVALAERLAPDLAGSAGARWTVRAAAG